MAFEIRIKPLVLFDLEDKIKVQEYESAGSGRRLYESFLSELTKLQRLAYHEAPVYESVRKHESGQFPGKLFYTITNETIFIMGLV